MTNEVIASSNQEIDLGLAGPIHYWSFHVGNSCFGLEQWQKSTCDILFVHHICTVPFTAPVTAALLLLIVALLISGAFYLIANRTRKSDPADA